MLVGEMEGGVGFSWKVEVSFLISTLSFGSMIRLISFFKEMSEN